jgi:hypothetical protein
MEITIPVLDKLVELLSDVFRRDRRKVLPHPDIVIGSYRKTDLEVAIWAVIHLDETTQPDLEVFLRRVRKGDPFCPHCQRPLDEWRASWMEDFGQIGYQCRDCRTQIRGDAAALLDELRREVRKDFLSYWTRYQEKLGLMTGGKHHKYKLPR